MNIFDLSNPQKLQRLVDFANTGIIIGLAISFIFGTTSILLSKKLIKAKDEKHKIEKRISDQKIAEANEKAAESHERATKTSLQLEKEKMKRLELEDAISPRIIEQFHSSEALKQFSNIKALISHIADFEAQRTARQIDAMLGLAKWKIESVPYAPKYHYPPGIVIEIKVGGIPKGDVSGKAAKEIVKQLKASKVKSWIVPTAADLPKNTINILVGLKPSDYFADKKQIKSGISVHDNINIRK